MNKKKNLLNIFTKDVSYNYHIVKTEEPNGHLIYLIKNGSDLNVETLEFAPTRIAEELVSGCEVQMEKFAPAIFFTEETNTEKLKYELNDKLSETPEFSAFIETIKDEYRILEVKDSLLFKKDPEAYEASKRKEHEDHQKELWDEMLEQLKNKKSGREEAILAYNNDLIKLMKEYFESIIEYEKKDFNWDSELEKLVGNLVDPETWIKINDRPFSCRIEIISLEQEKMNVFLTDNNEYSYTATMRFDKTVLVTENIVRINKGDALPECMTDYDLLAKLYDMDLTNIEEWDFKNHTDRFEYVIDYLAPIFKAEKIKKKQEHIEESLKDEGESEDDGFENDEDANENLTPGNYLFSVGIHENPDEFPPAIALVEVEFWNQNHGLDDSLGSSDLSKSVRKSLKKAGIYGDCELMESIWEIVNTQKTKEEIIESMTKEGFIYNPDITPDWK
jgi:hypothetical protein